MQDYVYPRIARNSAQVAHSPRRVLVKPVAMPVRADENPALQVAKVAKDVSYNPLSPMSKGVCVASAHRQSAVMRPFVF